MVVCFPLRYIRFLISKQSLAIILPDFLGQNMIFTAAAAPCAARTNASISCFNAGSMRPSSMATAEGRRLLDRDLAVGDEAAAG